LGVQGVQDTAEAQPLRPQRVHASASGQAHGVRSLAGSGTRIESAQGRGCFAYSKHVVLHQVWNLSQAGKGVEQGLPSGRLVIQTSDVWSDWAWTHKPVKCAPGVHLPSTCASFLLIVPFMPVHDGRVEQHGSFGASQDGSPDVQCSIPLTG
jgi:hypothetical protein